MAGSSATLPSILPKPSPDEATGPPSPSQPPQLPPPKPPNATIKRKRSFVALACAACRKRKTKCDGRRPVCQPCKQRQVECLYDFPDDVPAAQRGKRAIERLSQANVDLKSVIENLRSGDEEHALAVIRNIRAADTLDSSLEQITNSTKIIPPRTDAAYQNIIGSSNHERPAKKAESTTSSLDGQSESSVNGHRQPARRFTNRSLTDSIGSDQYMSSNNTQPVIEVLPISNWTLVPGDDQQYSELLTLLWTWDTMFTRVIDRRTFEEDLRSGAYEVNKDSPRRQFCSVFLVNSLLGFACAYTSDENKFTRTGESFPPGQLFIDQAEAALKTKKDLRSFDILQGLVMLFAYEVRVGDAKKAKAYMKLCFDAYETLVIDEAEVAREVKSSDLDAYKVIEAKAKAVWGLYVFEWRLSHTYGVRKRLTRPLLRKVWQDEEASLGQLDAPEYWWMPWPKSTQRRRSYYRELFDAECHLIEIAEDILVHTYPNEQDRSSFSPTQAQALALFTKLSEWKLWFMDTVPEEAIDLPQWLHISYCYEMLVVIVLRKVAHLTKEEFGTNESPQSLCHIHCNHIVALLWTYRSLYTIRYEFWAIQACSLVAFSTIFNIDHNTTLQDGFEKVCRMLYEISHVYPISADFLFSIRVVVQRYDIRVSKTALRYLHMVDRPRQTDLTEQWRAPIILAKSDGTRGGVADVSLGELIEGFGGLGLNMNSS